MKPPVGDETTDLTFNTTMTIRLYKQYSIQKILIYVH